MQDIVTPQYTCIMLLAFDDVVNGVAVQHLNIPVLRDSQYFTHLRSFFKVNSSEQCQAF